LEEAQEKLRRKLELFMKRSGLYFLLHRDIMDREKLAIQFRRNDPMIMTGTVASQIKF